MTQSPVIHHHFSFSKAIKENTSRCKHVTYENMPFFMLFENKSLSTVRYAIEALRVPMGHKYQKAYNRIKIAPNLLDCCYRADLVPMTFCQLNKQQFFVRAYYLRKNNFFKVEVTYFSETLGERKNYTFEKLYKSAERFFEYLQKDAVSLAPTLHLNEYFYIEDFKKDQAQWDSALSTIHSTTNTKVKESLIKQLVFNLSNFEANAKEIASKRLY